MEWIKRNTLAGVLLLLISGAAYLAFRPISPSATHYYSGLPEKEALHARNEIQLHLIPRYWWYNPPPPSVR
jgi:hypothetical protein